MEKVVCCKPSNGKKKFPLNISWWLRKKHFFIMDINMKLHMSLNMNMIIMLHQRTLMTFKELLKQRVRLLSLFRCKIVCNREEWIDKMLINTRFPSYHWHYAFLQIFTIGGASWTLDPSMEAANCKTKFTNKFILVAI